MKHILKKVLDELNKESPRIDYVKGMLEVLVDSPQETKPPVILHEVNLPTMDAQVPPIAGSVTFAKARPPIKPTRNPIITN